MRKNMQGAESGRSEKVANDHGVYLSHIPPERRARP
jgi:hypothetical protein